MRLVTFQAENGESFLVNAVHVRCIKPSGRGSTIEFDGDHYVTVPLKPEMVVQMIERATHLS
jgi:hypothetical protein